MGANERLRKPRFALRTVKHGRVKINDLTFVPQEHHRKYDGRLDGLRMAFGLYYGPKGYDSHRESDGWNTRFVCLWGTEECYWSTDPDGGPWPGPDCVDNHFPWQWWDAVVIGVDA